MPTRSPDLHGSAPDTCAVALLVIDMINDMGFDGGDRLLEQALPAARAVARLKRRAKAAGIPVVYVNDNYGRWQSDFQRLVAHCLAPESRGRPIVELLAPDPDDYFVLKPKHSGFYSTTLALLLEHLGAKTLILAGVAGNICVLFTANDAYMRDFRLVVPADCVASSDPAENAIALKLMADVLKADTRASDALDLKAFS